MTRPRDLFIAVLDGSGSMFNLREDTIGGCNSYINELKGTQDPARESIFSMLVFNTQFPKFNWINTVTPLDNVLEITEKDYIPSGGTPLNDAIMNAIAHALSTGADRVSIMVQTDGLENSSTENTTQAVRDAITRQTEAGWQFIFLGAGPEAFSQASSLGFAAGQAMNYEIKNSRDVMFSAASTSRGYASTGTSEDFTDEDRENAVK